APGKSSGQMLDAVERLVQEKYAGQGVGYAFSGQSYQERASGGQGGRVFALGLVRVFLVRAAQYESWSIPFAVLLAVPFGSIGAGVFFGMLVATTVGIFFIPLFFTVIRALSERGLARRLRESAAARQVAPAPATGD